jgi:hypothetical protein
MPNSVEMAVKIKQLKNGSFLMLWNIDLSDKLESSKTFQCEGHQPRFKVNYKYHEYTKEEIWDHHNNESPSLSNVDPTLTISLQFENKG